MIKTKFNVNDIVNYANQIGYFIVVKVDANNRGEAEYSIIKKSEYDAFDSEAPETIPKLRFDDVPENQLTT